MSKHRTEIGRRLRAFAATLDLELPLAAIARDHCTALLRDLQGRGWKPNTVFAYSRT